MSAGNESLSRPDGRGRVHARRIGVSDYPMCGWLGEYEADRGFNSAVVVDAADPAMDCLHCRSALEGVSVHGFGRTDA